MKVLSLIPVLICWLFMSWAVFAVCSWLISRIRKKQWIPMATIVAVLLVASYSYIWCIAWQGYRANSNRMMALQIFAAALLILVNYLQKVGRNYSSSAALIVIVPILWQIIGSGSFYLQWYFHRSLVYQRAMILTGNVFLLVLAYLRFLPLGTAVWGQEKQPPRTFFERNKWSFPTVAALALTLSLVLPWGWPRPPNIQGMYEHYLEMKMDFHQITTVQNKVEYLAKHLNYDAYEESRTHEGIFSIPSPKRTWGALQSRAVEKLLRKHTAHRGVPYLKEHAEQLEGKHQVIMNSLARRIASSARVDALNYISSVLKFMFLGVPEEKMIIFAGNLSIPEEHALTKRGARTALEALRREDYERFLKDTDSYVESLKFRKEIDGLDEGEKQKYLRLVQFIRQECRRRLDDSS